MKPIEEGCRAVIIGAINAENNGIIVTVGKFLGENVMCENGLIGRGRTWEIDKPIKSTGSITKKVSYDKHCFEDLLKRIDDYKKQETCEWSECAWRPEDVTA